MRRSSNEVRFSHLGRGCTAAAAMDRLAVSS
jgi:hypothetical protein